MSTLVKIVLSLALALACVTIALAQDQTTPVEPAASTQASPQEAAPTTPEAKTGEATQLQAQETKATIYFYRTKQFTGSALEPTVYGDDKELARMDNGRFFGVKLDPGTHTFRMGDNQTGFEIDMKAGQVYYARVTIEVGFWKGHGRLTLMQPEQGAFEIKKVKPLGVNKVKDRTLVVIYEGSDKQ